jgi:hypothetical protein
MTSPTPTPTSRKPTRWEEWRGVICFVVVVLLSSVVFWHLDDSISPFFARRHPFAKLLLMAGLFFDVMSLLSYVSTRVTGRSSSGVPGIGLVCYFWAWLSLPASVILGTPSSLVLLWLYKLLDLLALIGFSASFHIPFWFIHPKKQQPQ